MPIEADEPGSEAQAAQDTATLLGLLPVFIQMRHSEPGLKPNYLTYSLPEGYDVHPGESVVVGNFYQNTGDMPNTGTWSVVVGGQVGARLESVTHHDDSVTIGFSVPSDDGRRPATPEELHELTRVLGYIDPAKIGVTQPSGSEARNSQPTHQGKIIQLANFVMGRRSRGPKEPAS